MTESSRFHHIIFATVPLLVISDRALLMRHICNSLLSFTIYKYFGAVNFSSTDRTRQGTDIKSDRFETKICVAKRPNKKE